MAILQTPRAPGCSGYATKLAPTSSQAAAKFASRMTTKSQRRPSIGEASFEHPVIYGIHPTCQRSLKCNGSIPELNSECDIDIQ